TPGGSTADVARLHREADRFLRAQGNNAGRMRLRADATLRPVKPPRGLILSTGEDVPRGQSLRARLLVLALAAAEKPWKDQTEVERAGAVARGELDWSRLTTCQRDAAAGRYAEALAGYVRYLAPQYPRLRDGLRAETAALREHVNAEGL